MDYKMIKKRLTALAKTIERNAPDSEAYQNAAQESSDLLFENISIKEFAFVGEHYDGELTLELQAKMIAAAMDGKPLTDVILLDANATAAYNIRRSRQNQNISQIELAKKAGLTQSQVAKIENAQMNITVNILQNIIDVLGEEFTIVPHTVGLA